MSSTTGTSSFNALNVNTTIEVIGDAIIGNTLYDKKFIFKANLISEKNVEEVPILFVDGVIVRSV